MSEKIRDEFEAWYWAKLHGDRNASLRRAVFSKTSDGSYRGLKCDTAWCAWQASRAALVVELPPEREERFIDSYQEGWNDAIDSCRARLESAGATCK